MKSLFVQSYKAIFFSFQKHNFPLFDTINTRLSVMSPDTSYLPSFQWYPKAIAVIVSSEQQAAPVISIS